MLKKGDRRGEICGKICTENAYFCKDCFKTEDVRDIISRNHKLSEQLQIYSIRTYVPYNPMPINMLPPINFSKLRKLYTDIKNVTFPLFPHLKYIIELFAANKKRYSSEEATILKWYGNGNFRYDKRDKYYYFFNTEDEKWTKLSINNTSPVQDLKQWVRVDIINILHNLSRYFVQDSIIIQSLIEKIRENNCRINKTVSKCFITLLGYENTVVWNHEVEKNLVKFLKERVENIKEKKHAITTNYFMEKYNEWCKVKNIPGLQSTLHFARVLSKVNIEHDMWRTFNDEVVKHLVAFK